MRKFDIRGYVAQELKEIAVCRHADLTNTVVILMMIAAIVIIMIIIITIIAIAIVIISIRILLVIIYIFVIVNNSLFLYNTKHVRFSLSDSNNMSMMLR